MTDSKQKISVVVVDDEDVIRESLTQFLSDMDCAVQGFADPREALDALEQGLDPDVAVVDVRMPHMSGEEFAQRAAALRPSLRFLLQTGAVNYAPPESLARLGVGPENVLHKPVFSLTTYWEHITRLAER